MMKSNSSSNVECVYHGERYVFAALVRDMRRTKLLSRKHANVMAMTVCTCRRKVSHRQSISEQQVRDAANQATNVANTALDKFALTSRELVTSSANIASKTPMTSQGRLIVVICQALLGQTILLEEERSAADLQQGKMNSEKCQVVPRKYVCKIIKKKKKKLPVTSTITLPLFGGSTSQLFLTPTVGPKFSRLGKKFGCVIEVDGDVTGRYMAANQRKTALKIWAPSRSVTHNVTKELSLLATKIQEQSNAVFTTMKKHRRQLLDYKYLSIRNAGDMTFPQDYKESLSDDFDKKAFKEMKRDRKLPKAQRTGPSNRTTEKKTPQKRKDESTLLGGHCFNCLVLYSDFRQGNDDVKQCRHHPGYLLDSEWTCCKNKSDHVRRNTAEDHTNNGCVVKQQHTWRPCKKASRGMGAKTASFEKRRMTLAPHTRVPLIY